VGKYLLPKFTSKSFAVTTKQGDPITFDANSIKRHLELAQMIKVETDRRSIPWEIVEEHG
jgi:hypothetical protein